MAVIKKLLMVSVAVLIVLSACSRSMPPDDRTLDHFIQAFGNAGHSLTVLSEGQMVEATSVAQMDTPLYSMVGAINGTLFYHNGSPVKIYQYKDKAAIDKAFKDFPVMNNQGWVVNGFFVIETNSDEVRAFFATIPLAP
ncbi:MAG: hypothetical protein FWC40_08585 [Proteobacteria bacterium]|nr:hypothetical protein [Pseudomonadota bacterium]